MTIWNKEMSTILAQKSAAVLWHCYRSKNKIPRTLKRFVCKLLRSLFRRRFCRQNWYYAQTLHLFDLQIFFITMPQEARKGKSWGGTSMRASKRTLWVFTAFKQLKNRGTKGAFILIVVRPTVVQSSFHTEFLSSIIFSLLRPLRLLQRRKRTRIFFCVFVRTWRRAKAKLANNKS